MSLAHVYWLGGSACAGKTSVARRLAAEHGLALFSCDERFEEHRRRADPERHARFCRVADLAPEALLSGSPAAQAAELLEFYEDEWEMVCEDLAAISGPVLAEGVGLLPERIADVLAAPRRGIWMIASEALRRSFYTRRAATVSELLGRCRDPQQALASWMERDSLVAAAIEAGARSRGLEVLIVDGSRSLEETTAAVARRLRLGPRLTG